MPDAAALTRARAALARDAFAAFLGIAVAESAGEGFACVLPVRAHVIGNPHLRAVHGGALAALVESTGAAWLAARGLTVARIADSHVDYLRPAIGEALHACAEAVRVGRRVANMAVRVWSTRPDQPIASGQVNYLLEPA